MSRAFLSIAMLEFWERFALSAVKSLLVLMLIDHVLVGDLSQVIGARTAFDASTRIFGPVSSTALASQLYGYANALVYLAVPLGGVAGDLLGRRDALVAGGGASMVGGLVLMLDDRFFLLGLVPFMLGAGVLKGNLSTAVGLLFTNEAERRRGYSTYLGFLNAGVICGPLICGTLAAMVGPPYAIAAAALAVGLGLVPYLRHGRVDEAAGARVIADAGAPGRREAIALLGVALVATYLCYAAYDQLGDVFLVWARTHVDLRIGSATMPVAWFLSLDGAITLALIVLSQAAFGALERRGRRVAALEQIMAGGACCALGYGVLALVSVGAGPAQVSMGWTLVYLLLVDAAIVLVWPSALSLIASLAPRTRVGSWTGLFYLHGFVANLWVGFSSILYERMPTTRFWLLHAAIAAVGALLVLLVGRPLQRAWRDDQATTTSAWAKASA